MQGLTQVDFSIIKWSYELISNGTTLIDYSVVEGQKCSMRWTVRFHPSKNVEDTQIYAHEPGKKLRRDRSWVILSIVGGTQILLSME